MSAGLRAAIKGTDLGVDNLTNIAVFMGAASSLGLLEAGIENLSQFLMTAAQIGGLSPIKLTWETAAACASMAINAGILAHNASVERVASLLDNAKVLGITDDNMKDRLGVIMGRANKHRVYPLQEVTGNLAADTGVTSSKLKFVPYDVSILEAIICQAINEHPRLYIKGVLNSELSMDNNKAAALYSVDLQGQVEIIFQGVVRTFKQGQTRELTYMEAEVVSSSYNLDMEKNSRLFSEKAVTYKELLQELAQDTAHIIMEVENTTIEKPFVQHRETDWQFLKRLAGQLNTGLVAIAASDETKIIFGVPCEQEASVIRIVSYAIQKDLGRYRAMQIKGLGRSLADADFTQYKVESYDRLAIGDCIHFLNQLLYVKEVYGVLEQGRLKYRYTLVHKGGLSL